MGSALHIPRIVISATGSGVGKTTVTVAILGALRARGLRVASFKCGPDYLDPTYHARVLGKPSQNLDSWMMGREALLSTFARASEGADIAVAEGMMGLFDGAAADRDEGSTAEIAKWLGAPVLLVHDASGIARTIAAVAQGFARFDPGLRVAGLICNKVGSRGHLDLLTRAQPEVPILGGFPRNSDLAFPERHLGLIHADRETVPDRLIEEWTRLAAEWLDLDAIVEVARSAPDLEVPTSPASSGIRRARCRIGIAYDAAFHFYYEDNLRRLEELGADLIRFSPTGDTAPPEVDGLYFGGGYPEVMARELSSNSSMLEAVRRFAREGHPIYAECGGLMYLSEGIRTLDGTRWPMAALLPGVAVMADRLQALGYVEVETQTPTILGPSGLRFRGHQFRYSTLEPTGGELRADRAYSVAPRWGPAFPEGFAVGNVLASYVHAHWASNPHAAEGFVNSCETSRRR
ncbi:MAG: cobyrinate a,c-diamide synthase [Candidatus Binataceae bacterium]